MAVRTGVFRLEKLLLAALLLLAAWVAVESQRTLRADWSTQAARAQIDRWLASSKAEVDPQDWAVAEAALLHGLALTPQDAALHERLGDLYAVAGVRDWQDEALRREQYARAAAQYEAALVLRPGSAKGWAGLASARQAMQASTDQVHTAWRSALRLGPLEGHVQPILLQVVLADWDGAAPEMREWAKTLFDRSNKNKRLQINALAKYYGLVFTPDTPQDAP